MRAVVLLLLSVLTLSGCQCFDNYDDDDRPRVRDREDDPGRLRDRGPDRDRDLPPRDDETDRSRLGNLRWIGPGRDNPPIYPSVPNLQPINDPIPPRAEDPSWRNR